MAVNQTLKTASGSNVLTGETDPNRNIRRAYVTGGVNRCLSGRRVYDIQGIHYDFALEFEFMDADFYEKLRELYYSGELLYYDDGNVPPLVETFTYKDGTVYTYSGITNPSGTHIAYYETTADLPTAKDDIEDSEFTTAMYGHISQVAELVGIVVGAGTEVYPMMKFMILASEATADVSSVKITVRCFGGDPRPATVDGCVLLVWNGTEWYEIGRSTTTGYQNIIWDMWGSELIEPLIDTDDDYIRLILRSRGFRLPGYDLSLGIAYVEVETNPEGRRITLTHTPILSSGDVIWVKNLTTVQTLELTTDYTISGRVVTVSGQSDDDAIEVKYNRYFEVKFADLPEDWLRGDPGSDRNRGAVVNLTTQTGGVVDS